LADFRDSIIETTALKRFWGRRPRCGFITASLRCPEEPISQSEWSSLAARAGFAEQELCCRWIEQFVQPAAGRSAA
jgi:hypothetical protein